MSLLINLYLNTIRLWFFSTNNIQMYPRSVAHLRGPYQGIHIGRKIIHSIHTFQPCNPSDVPFVLLILLEFSYTSQGKNLPR